MSASDVVHPSHSLRLDSTSCLLCAEGSLCYHSIILGPGSLSHDFGVWHTTAALADSYIMATTLLAM